MSRSRLARSGLLLRIHGGVRRRLAPGIVASGGHWFANDPTDTLGLAQGLAWEPFEAEVIQRLLKPNDIAFDVGAHIGYHTLPMARVVGRGGRVVAFEPDPENRALLERSVRLNGYRNVTIEPSAVGAGPGVVSLYRSLENRGDNRIVDPGEDDRPIVRVPRVSLDDYAASHGLVADLVKMDIQGAEAEALEGMERLVASSPRLAFICEFWPFGLARAGADPVMFVGRLERLGFEVVHMDLEAERLEPADPDALVRRYPATAFDLHTNLLCVLDPSRLSPLAEYLDPRLSAHLRLDSRADGG